MKKFYVLVALMVLVSACTFAFSEEQGPGSLLYRGTYVQGWSPNGLYSATLTSQTTHDLTNFLAWGVYCDTGCKGRALPTSTNSSAYPTFTIPPSVWYVEVKNKQSPFINISGAHEWKQQ